MKKKKSSLPSSRQVLVGIFLLLCGICLYSIKLSHSVVVLHHGQQRELTTIIRAGSDRKNTVPCQLQQQQPSSPSTPSNVSYSYWWDEMTHAGSTSCTNVHRHVQMGLWKDPNQGQHYIRKIDEAPYHFLSVHNKDYDRVRFSSIFRNGKYYEHKVHGRFESILQEQPIDEHSTTTSARISSNSLPMVLDVGANIGYYSLLSAARQHAVVAFEINPANLIRLCESIQWNTNFYNTMNADEITDRTEFFGPIRLFRHGVSNQHNQTVQVVVPKRNPGEASVQTVSEKQLLFHRQQQQVLLQQDGPTGIGTNQHPSFATTITLDQFASDHGWFDSIPTNASHPQIDIAILKIDTEGHEPYILQGATKLLQSHLVRNILLEYRTTCRDAIVQIVLEAGYVLVYDQPSDAMRGRTMLTKEASKGYIDKLHRSHSLQDAKGNETLYEDLWFRLASHKLPPVKRDDAIPRLRRQQQQHQQQRDRVL
ncbi:FkbM family methyltransferase [Nitzschia inconspicua]|uniref:FkbM family methyltransferase n=1 Tax=Nitzschia inconspicua TaxID=303405 RepID=A0A9K3LXM2_9STRA|nr:FkbM family methyltransferase [Nitzschia inconspicua]